MGMARGRRNSFSGNADNTGNHPVTGLSLPVSRRSRECTSGFPRVPAIRMIRIGSPTFIPQGNPFVFFASSSPSSRIRAVDSVSTQDRNLPSPDDAAPRHSFRPELLERIQIIDKRRTGVNTKLPVLYRRRFLYRGSASRCLQVVTVHFCRDSRFDRQSSFQS